jgi:hypothetical protein
MQLHELLKDIYGESNRVHLVQTDDDGWENPEGAWAVDEVEGENEAMLVNTVQQEGSSWRELDDSWLELNGGECGRQAGSTASGPASRKAATHQEPKGGSPMRRCTSQKRRGP